MTTKIYRFDEYNRLDESLLTDFLDKIPALKRFKEQIYKVYTQVCDDIKKDIETLSEEDKKAIYKYIPKLSGISEGKNEADPKLHKMRKIFARMGVSTAALGVLTNVASLIITNIQSNGFSSTPVMVIGVIMLCLGLFGIYKGMDDDGNVVLK